MTHIQQLFIKNIRYYRTKAGFSQLSFSERINISPNYLNAVENGKNFPSLDVLQKMIDELGLLPYQLFLEEPDISERTGTREIAQLATDFKQRIVKQLDDIIQKYSMQQTFIEK